MAVAVDQERRQDHERQQLEEFGLPVIRRAGPELPEKVADLQRLIMLLLVVGPGEPLGHQLTNPRQKNSPAKVMLSLCMTWLDPRRCTSGLKGSPQQPLQGMRRHKGVGTVGERLLRFGAQGHRRNVDRAGDKPLPGAVHHTSVPGRHGCLL